ncbi:MAG: FAD binding domain-containing protein [Nitrososphaerales archaeon]
MLYELPNFEYYDPTTLDEALEILHKYPGKAKILGGGTDLLGLMKDRVMGAQMPVPSVLVDIKRIEELRALSHTRTHTTIGAAVTLTEIASNPTIADRYTALSQAAGLVATNQIRNMGTLGGNLCQRPWCWYFRHPAFDCFKKGGKQCFAITGDNSTYFSVYNLGTCVMGSPSDTAPALISLGATAKIANQSAGIREVNLSDFYLGPKNVQDNILKPDEILVSVTIPRGSENQKSVYLKHRIRNNWDFALASVAATGALDSERKVAEIRIVLGGVAPLPLTLKGIEEALLGKKLTEESKTSLAKLASSQAHPLKMNGYKVRIVKSLLNRALDSIFSQ